MSKLRVVYPCFNIDDYNWQRVSIVLKYISSICDLTIYHFDNKPSPHSDFCRIVKVPTPRNILNLGLLMPDILHINMELPEYDLMYCWSGGGYAQLLNVLTAQTVDKPCVMHINGDGSLSRSHYLSPAQKILEDAVDRASLNNCTRIVPISSVLKKAMMQRVKNKQAITEPAPFSVDTEDFTQQHFPKELTVGYGGRVSPEKGFPFYIDVMHQTKTKFRIAGPIQMKTEFPENCHYDGLLDMSFMPRFYGLCSVLALPSYGEGIPGMILEAYACGRPVIVTPEALPPCMPCFGWTLNRNIPLWKTTIEGLTQKEIQEQGQKAREWVTSKWPTWTDFSQQMKGIFEDATAN